MSKLYERIKELEAEQGLTDGSLSKKAGISTSLLNRIKNEDGSISRKTAEKIAAALGVDVAYLYGDIDTVDEIRDELFEKRRILFDLSSKATEEDLDTMIKIFKGLINDE